MWPIWNSADGGRNLKLVYDFAIYRSFRKVRPPDDETTLTA